MTAPPGALAHEGVPRPMRRSPLGEMRNAAPAERYSAKAVVAARGTQTHRRSCGTPPCPGLFRAAEKFRGAARVGDDCPFGTRVGFVAVAGLAQRFPGARHPRPVRRG